MVWEEQAAFHWRRERAREQVWGMSPPGREGKLTMSVPVRHSGGTAACRQGAGGPGGGISEKTVGWDVHYPFCLRV